MANSSLEMRLLHPDKPGLAITRKVITQFYKVL